MPRQHTPKRRPRWLDRTAPRLSPIGIIVTLALIALPLVLLG